MPTKQEDRDEIHTGDIVAAVGLKHTRTGDTLTDARHPIQLESMTFPDPVISSPSSRRPRRPGQARQGLSTLAEEDPTFTVRTDEETGQTIIAAWASCTSRSSSTACCVSSRSRPTSASPRSPTARPSSAGQEAQATPQAADRRFRHVCRVVIDLEPTGPAGGFEFEDQVKGGNVPREYIPAVEKGLNDALDRGVLAGYPLVDVKATLTDGSSHAWTRRRWRSRSPARWR
jgi:elongation factor G